MGKKKITQITVEVERLFSIIPPRSLFALCQQWGDEVRLVTVHDAAATAGVNSLTIYRLVESGTLHHAETGADELLVFAASLRSLISNRKGER